VLGFLGKLNRVSQRKLCNEKMNSPIWIKHTTCFVLASQTQEGANFKLNISSFLTEFTDFAKKHAHFCRQRFTEFVEILSKRPVSHYFYIVPKGRLPPAR
jgi:hypothetical protein